ncbi:helix-turn-helix domain-containing protein [Streptomyces iakyrus]|uniref:helix-turn-helix domain-containing protein n=1 Tax=Streptomyces iakyrus TaxID=68219 RepID=UPI00052594C2|nr:helix-turn-helix domain-containing protein [Streptomyces iakyrus]
MTGRPITGETRYRARRRAAQLYMEGCTITSVARQIGYSYGTARTLILEAGVRLRRSGSRQTRRIR